MSPAEGLHFSAPMCTYILIHLYAHTHTHTDTQPVTQRVCPNCEESCHIRCKKCPECEHEFPPSTKSRAKPDKDIVKNPSNLLQILQKKVTIQYTLYTVLVPVTVILYCTALKTVDCFVQVTEIIILLYRKYIYTHQITRLSRSGASI